ncbi:MAG: LacI family transcriptional regulator, partial [Paenibacillus sp.]|nr:LacI family transcriptional regulator [Paenibacillus sp.]
MGSKTIRQKEIAERTGFSINTVSLALQGSSRISEETRHKILQCAEQLNYIPNVVARSLVQKRTNIIGIILTQLMNPIL